MNTQLTTLVLDSTKARAASEAARKAAPVLEITPDAPSEFCSGQPHLIVGHEGMAWVQVMAKPMPESKCARSALERLGCTLRPSKGFPVVVRSGVCATLIGPDGPGRSLEEQLAYFRELANQINAGLGCEIAVAGGRML